MQVPLYSEFIKERFERCLDLYLAPRARRMRLHVASPEALLPQLPKPRDLQPFPTTLLLKFLGHVGKVRSPAGLQQVLEQQQQQSATCTHPSRASQSHL